MWYRCAIRVHISCIASSRHILRRTTELCVEAVVVCPIFTNFVANTTTTIVRTDRAEAYRLLARATAGLFRYERIEQNSVRVNACLSIDIFSATVSRSPWQLHPSGARCRH